MLLFDWQKTRKEISLQELEKLFPGILESFGYEKFPPEKIFLYEGDFWIAQLDNGNYSLNLESSIHVSTSIEKLESILFDWAS
jgi:hypothetical protein